MRRNGIVIKFIVPFLLVALAATLVVVVADKTMEDFPMEHRQDEEQVAQHRQPKWLIEKFKRQKPPKSHYGKPKAYFKAPKPQYSVPTVPTAPQYSPPTAPQYSQPIPPLYSQPQENYPQNSFQSSYPTPSFELSQLPISPPSPNYFENPSPFNPPAVYRQPEAAINAPQPEYPVQQQPFIQQLPEGVPNPNQYQNEYNPPQAAYWQPEVINTTPRPDYSRLPPTNSPSQTAYNSQESSAAYHSQELPDSYHSAPQEESKILPQPEVTTNQYSKQLPFIHQQPYAGTANNNYQQQQQQPEPGTESYRETTNPPRQPHKTQVVNVVQQPYRNPVSGKIPQQPHPSRPVPAVNNPPQGPYAAQVVKSVPVQPSNGEGINNNDPQQHHTQAVNNIPSQHQTYRKPVSPPQQPYTQAVNHAPQQQTYLELTKNNSPEEFGDYSQPAYTESPQNPLQTSTNSDNGYDSQNNFPPAVEDNNEQNYFSPPQPAPIYLDESPVNSPILSLKEPANSRPTDDVFSPSANNPEIPPLFYNDFAPTEKVKSVKDGSNEGFFEFGIFPKSNSFFLQNYKG